MQEYANLKDDTPSQLRTTISIQQEQRRTSHTRYWI